MKKEREEPISKKESSGKVFEVKEPSRFNVKGTSAGYQPRQDAQPYVSLSEETILQWNSEMVLSREPRGVLKAQYNLFVQPSARETIFAHIGWITPRRQNSVEQGGILLGEVIQIPDGRFFGIVKRAIPAHQGKGTSAYLRIDHSAWKEMYDAVAAESQSDGQNQIIGWYHTHPNSLDVFMSGTDMNTQRTMFASDWQFAIVLNPHRRIWKAFHGAEAFECPGYILRDSNEPADMEGKREESGAAMEADTDRFSEPAGRKLDDEAPPPPRKRRKKVLETVSFVAMPVAAVLLAIVCAEVIVLKKNGEIQKGRIEQIEDELKKERSVVKALQEQIDGLKKHEKESPVQVDKRLVGSGGAPHSESEPASNPQDVASESAVPSQAAAGSHPGPSAVSDSVPEVQDNTKSTSVPAQTQAPTATPDQAAAGPLEAVSNPFPPALSTTPPESAKQDPATPFAVAPAASRLPVSGSPTASPSTDTPSTVENPDSLRAVQKKLAALGFYRGNVDGHFGPNTNDAIRKFQKSNGLPVTGSLDAGTLAKLEQVNES